MNFAKSILHKKEQAEFGLLSLLYIRVRVRDWLRMPLRP